MSNRVKSARGEVVDFDLLRIKQQIAAAPPQTSVKTRENFIDKKYQRRIKKLNLDKVSPVLPDVSVEPTMPETNNDVENTEIQSEKSTKKQK